MEKNCDKILYRLIIYIFSYVIRFKNDLKILSLEIFTL